MVDEDDPTIRQEIRFKGVFPDYTWKMSDWMLTGIGGFFYWSNTKTGVNRPWKGDDIEPDDIEEILPDEVLEEVIKEFLKGRDI